MTASALQDSAMDGSLVISDIVYAEICMHFDTRLDCDAFLESIDIRVEALTRESHFLASRAWRTYRGLFPALFLYNPSGSPQG